MLNEADSIMLRVEPTSFEWRVDLLTTSIETARLVLAQLPIREKLRVAEYAGNEIYILIPCPANAPSSLAENLTIVPAAGDVVAWIDPSRTFLEIGFFFDNYNLLLSSRWGFTPVSVFARAKDAGGTEAMAASGNAIKRQILTSQPSDCYLSLTAS